MAVPECLADRYEVRGLLGRGGMGDVYEGWDRRLERTVAIKLLNEDLSAHRDIRTRFEHEARAAAMLVSAKVVAVFDTGEHEGVPYIVMERLPGRSLADELAGGPLPQERVRAILLDMLEALAAAHQAGVIHRDIKPSNVLLTASGTAKIADFGIAKSTEQNLTQTGTLVGTAAYLSPERVMGLPATAQSDIYSAGVVAFEALSGQTPFQSETPIGLVRAIMDDPMTPIRDLVPGVDEDLAAAIEKATRKAPEDRFESARAMAGALSPDAEQSVTPAAALTPVTVVRPAATLPAGHVGATSATRTLTVAARTAVNRARTDPRKKWVVIGAATLFLLLLVVRLNSDDTPPAGAVGPTPAEPASPPGEGDAGEEDQAGGAGPYPVAGVSSVHFLGPGTLQVKIGDESLRIEAPDELLPALSTVVSGSTLTLGSQAGSQPAGIGNVIYHLSVRSLTGIQATGSGTIRVEGLSEPALTVEGIGSANTTVSGEAGTLALSLSGSGNFEGSGLRVTRATAQISGSGDAELNVSQTLQAELSGSGSLEFKGNPQVTQSAFGSGAVTKTG